MSADERTRTVQDGYDAVAPRYREWLASIEGEPWERFAEELSGRLPEAARVLDLGCGDGAKAKRLAEHFQVVGVDISKEQVQRARAQTPEATFVQADFAEIDFPAEAFDAVVALYSIMHLPRDRHPELFARVFRWLKSGGLFLAALSTTGGPDRIESWLGVAMFFSGWSAETNSRLVREAGFELLVDEEMPMREPEPESDYETAFLWLLARKPE